ncbi:MAG: acetyl-CoA hydrolase/transferase family protein [Myxococcales bacterium]|nr:acetyl-CoA hydrolase/transferase family protein [Myxococcales bacterium]MCB9715865.1 acetyl-CoA hydrolase/transferase family protein [Myxococcales bacterium]
MMKTCSAESAVACIQSGQRVYLHEASMAPHSLLEALVARAPELSGVEVVHLHVDGPAPHVAPELAGHLRHNALFVGGNTRAAVAAGRADFTPVFLGEIPSMFRSGTLPLDVAMVQVSLPDAHGYCRLGLSVACALPAVESAKVVIAEINPRVPQTMGNSAIHINEIDYAVEIDRPLPEVQPAAFGPQERAIGEHVARLVPNGATIQVGIGKVPNAVLAALSEHEDLGVHTEMFSDGLLELARRRVITGRHKTRFERRVVTSFATGTRALHEFVHSNPFVEFHPSNVVNDPNEIRKQHQMVAINSALEIDLTGQVCADSMGEQIHSGIGGQMDFVQGALRSPGGRAIIALPSTAGHGEARVSRIVPRLKAGAGVVTTRGHVQWVVTEHGAVNLRGRTLRERAELLIEVADPEFRSELRAAAALRNLGEV